MRFHKNVYIFPRQHIIRKQTDAKQNNRPLECCGMEDGDLCATCYHKPSCHFVSNVIQPVLKSNK